MLLIINSVAKIAKNDLNAIFIIFAAALTMSYDFITLWTF